MNRRTFLTGTAGAAIIFAGCNQVDGSDDETTRLPELVSNPDAVRTCKTGMSTFPVDEWSDLPVVAGPIGFYSPLDDDLEEWIYPYKMPIVVKPNTTVTVVVPEADREHVALSHAPPPHREPDKLKDGQRSVRFESCDEPTIFIGRIFAEIVCVSLQIWVNAENHPQKVTLPIGVERCN